MAVPSELVSVTPTSEMFLAGEGAGEGERDGADEGEAAGVRGAALQSRLSSSWASRHCFFDAVSPPPLTLAHSPREGMIGTSPISSFSSHLSTRRDTTSSRRDPTFVVLGLS